ncbi:MAG: peptidylprolyl isomerase, partial [Sphingobacteriales bacterium]
IDYNEFQEEMNRVEENFAAQNGKTPSETDMPGLREQAWNQLIFKIAFQKEFDRLGLTVSEEEMVDMVQGNNVHPAIRQAFVNPQTQQFDRSQVVNYLKNFEQLQPEQRAMWATFEASLAPDRLRTKFTNLMKASEYVTTAEAKQFHQAQNAKASVKFLYIPFFTVNDTTIKVTDDELEAYLSKNRDKYKTEEGRSIQYVALSVNPSGTDSANVQKEVEELAQQFRTAENDSLFVKANSDAPYNGAYLGMGELPQSLSNKLPLEVGNVYGPFQENGTYKLFKVINTKNDSVNSVRASHILFKVNGETDEAKAEALKKAQEVLGQIKGGASFEEMARQHGTDGTASVGGDLGWFSQGRMVKEFEQAVFNFNGTGLLPQPVKTQFGYHIIKVTEPKTSRKYQIAALERTIESSDDTKDEAFRKADELSGTSTDMASFTANVAKDKSLVMTEAKNIGANDRNINNVTNARELIRWAYNENTAVGSVSPVFEADDKFVVAVLTGKREKGQPKV